MEETTTIEYGVWDNQENELLLDCGENRERAIRMSTNWNRARPGATTVVTHTVTTTAWTPANTGVVPPHITENKE